MCTVVKSAGTEECTTESVVLRLSEGIPKHNNYDLYFDYCFSTLDVMLKLQSIGIFATVTFTSNGNGCCPLETEAEFKKKGRGSSDYMIDLTITQAST